MNRLRIAPGLQLDADYVGGGTFALLAKKGAGKTYTGRVMAEEMWKAKVPFVVLDPMGAWWGLRSSADGQSDGIPVAIFGGDHADAPLERTGGALMADLVVDEGLSMILDMRGFGTRAGERQFALEFLERLYRRNRELIHLFIDEADLVRPPDARERAMPESNGEVQLKAGARRMLAALASLHPAWLTRAQVGTLAKVKHTGGTFGDYLSAMRRAGVIEENGHELRITDAGFAALGTAAPAPATTEELLQMWRDRLKRGARAMLDELVARYPDWLTRDDLAIAAGIEVTGGTFGDYLSTLRRTGLIDEDAAKNVRASETLFLGS